MFYKYKKLSFLLLLPSLCFAQPTIEDSKNEEEPQKLGELIYDQIQDIPMLNGLELSGTLKAGVAFSNQSLSDSVENPYGFLDGEINIDYKKINDGVAYGFKTTIKALSGVLKEGDAIVDSAYLFIETDKLGEFRFGHSESAGNIFSVCYADVLTGYNLVDSGYLHVFYAPTSGTILGTGFDNDDGKALKLAWLSPTIKGWTVGLSYAPNSRNGHLFKENREKLDDNYKPLKSFTDDSSFMKDMFSGGISYENGDPEEFYYKVAIAGWTAKGKADFSKVRNVRGYNIGAIIGYKNVKLGLGFTDNGNSMLPDEFANPNTDDTGLCPGANAGKIYNIGLAYTHEKWEMSAGYFHAVKKYAKRERAISNIATIAVQYNMDRVLSTFVEYNNIRTRTCNRSYKSELIANGSAVKNNRANLFIVGVKVNL